MSDSESKAPQKQTLIRLHPSVMEQIERKILGSGIVVNHQTTDLMAGYQLGVQAVMNLLRKDYLIGE